MSTKFFTVIATVVAILLGAATARAGDEFRTRGTGSWASYTIWEIRKPGTNQWDALISTDPVPGCGDTATIRAGHSVGGEGQSITVLTVENGGQLNLNGVSPTFTVCGTGASLTLSDNYNSNHIPAVRVTHTAGSTPYILISADTDLFGSGTIEALTPSQIAISASGSSTVTLANKGPQIVGLFTIEGNGTGTKNFDNRGLVWAKTSGGQLKLDSSLSSVTDVAGSCSSPRWKVSNNGLLVFDRAATSLHGDFAVGPGQLRVGSGASVATDGLLKLLTDGYILVLGSETFDVTGTGGTGTGNHYCSGSNCTSESFPYSAGSHTCP